MFTELRKINSDEDTPRQLVFLQKTTNFPKSLRGEVAV